MNDWDYIVVGAGIEGSWTALQLIQLDNKPRVLLLEQFPLPHSRGSSHGQTRIIRHAYIEKFYARMMPQAFQDWHKLEQETGERLFIPKDLLLYADEGGYEDLDLTLESMKDLFPGDGGRSFRQLSAVDLALEYPQVIFTEKHRGLVDKTAGLLFADRCLATVQRRFCELGGVIRDRTHVTSLTPGHPVTLELSSKVKVTAAKVAVCAGPWTSKLLDPLLTTKLPLTTLRVPVYYWRIKKDGPGFMNASFKDMSGKMATEYWGLPECEYQGMVKVGQPSQCIIDPDCRDAKIDSTEDFTAVSKYISERFPGLETEPSIIEACMYSMTPDEICIMDHVDENKNLVFACGFSGSGFKKAPVVGRMLCQLLNPPCQMDMSPFVLSRFDTEK